MQELGQRVHQWLYVISRGWIGHRLIGVPSLLLRTVGRRTGKPRANALVYATDAGSYVVVASNGGGDRSSGWYFNALSQPDVEIQLGRWRTSATARSVVKGDPDYERLWRLANATNHNRYEGYQSKTSRPIPMLVLTPR